MACREHVLRVVKSGRTRRSLFGPVDRVQLEQEYHTALRKDLEDASRRWSFDFLCETPLEGGDFLWEGVSEARLPVLYRPCEKPSRAREGTPWMSEEKENVPRSPERRVTQSTHIEKTPEKRAMKRKQTNITDFYQMKKRLVATPRKSGQ